MRWSESLAGIARTGLGFTDSLYERERFEEVLAVAADIKVAAGLEFDTDSVVYEWMKQVGDGVGGYVTPKVAVGAVVGDDDGRILLIQRADSGIWLYPTGWADVGYSASEVAVKEVWEETGIECEVIRPIGDLRRHAPGLHPDPPLLDHLPVPGHRRRAAGPSPRDPRRRVLRRGRPADARCRAPSCGRTTPSRPSGARTIAVMFDPPRRRPWRVDD